MYHITLRSILLLIFLQLSNGQQDFEDVCIKCLCNSYTKCTDLKNCARATITYKYWTDSMKDEVDYEDQTYEECLRDDDCILRTMKNFFYSFGYMDCNGDNRMDCTDYAAVHLSGGGACQGYRFPEAYMMRLNGCIMREHGRNEYFMRDPRLRGREPPSV